MKSNSFLQVIIFFALMFCSSPATAALNAAAAEAFAEEQGRNLLEILAEKDYAEKYRKLDDLFINYVDLDYISRFVVGKYWRQMTPEQQRQYQGLFRRYAVSLYKGFPLDFGGRLNFAITGSRAEEGYTLVLANITYNGAAPEENKNILAEFRMHEVGNKIMLTDVKIAESSMLLSYRNRFYQMIKEADEEMEWFLEDFELLTQSAEKMNEDAMAESEDNL